ncbi:hypothetical protein CSC33_1756 [Pseudomonas aeruginosa]|nr:hypothetical protein CSC33_1756 [Pseudomonas aeruginosa]
MLQTQQGIFDTPHKALKKKAFPEWHNACLSSRHELEPAFRLIATSPSQQQAVRQRGTPPTPR